MKNEKMKREAKQNKWAPKPYGMNQFAWAMGQRQIAQAKQRGMWRGNDY